MDQKDQSTDSDSCVLEMHQLAHELEDKLATLNSSKAQGGDGCRPCSIVVGKVRDLTRNVDSSEYDPDHVAIGPYNYPRPQSNNPHLAMEHDKLASLDMVLSAAKAARPAMTVDVYVKELACLERDTRNCYANTFEDMTSEQFVRMLLLDACYILSRLVGLRSHHLDLDDVGTAEAAVSSANRAEALAVVRDVFYLAENQIPFFVLEKIGELTTLDGKDRVLTEISDYALDLMRRQMYAMAAPAMVLPEQAAPGNLLHLLHMHLKPLSVSPAVPFCTADPMSVRRWRSATEYNFVGVKFKARAMGEKGLIRCILDVKLDGSGGTLEVPCLDIDSETWRLLRNLIELEQRNRETVGSHVTAYCVFISQVACTTKDVELLSKRGVIVHGHGNNEEVAKCFADLCKGIQFDPDDPNCNYLRETCKKLEKRFQSYPRRWIAWLKQRYLRNPWLAVGLLAAVIGLVLAVIQTVYSVLCYYKQQ
ncbi:hypothetical protein VPH35_056124 [Triticum aestivum]|uniref:Uncharacterized protein n=3 Tax=Triticum aestivum TaxID=4565 RepID=A0A3B6U3V8_WHEAT|nr:UPF0481 protein At3g47200-like [Triticum aestivum]XP_044352076.1 UPF0481 protein At3g47200-like [Triticum aestivum]XP_044446179.1 UPF0481 protein At3g47200-like [Triticum aestivum]XP_044446614.1 UPF0481 protein At3g47200-like [Triticum aestivum]